MAWLQLKWEFPAPLPPREALSSIKRLEWWHRDDASRTGGINSLSEVLDHTPNVEYLALGGVLQPYSFSRRGRRLEHLKTLRLYKANVYFLWLISTWQLPSLHHLILDWSPEPLAIVDLAHFFSGSLQSVELGRNLCFLARDHVIPLLRVCPHLVELSYYVHFTLAPTITDSYVHPSLKTVRLHAHTHQLFDDDQQIYRQIGAHLAFLASVHLPSLQHVALHGEWCSTLTEIRALPQHQELLRQGRQLEQVGGAILA